MSSPRRSWKPSVQTLMAVVVTGAAGSVALARPTDMEVDDLITKLGDNSFQVRQGAQKALEGHLNMLALTTGQIGKIRTATGSADLEVKTRAERLLQTWTSTVGPVKEVLDQIRVRTIHTDGLTSAITFDGYVGVVANNSPVFSKLETRFSAVQASLTGGNIAEFLPELNKLKDAINGFTDAEVGMLSLTTPAGDQNAGKAEMLTKVNGAITKAQAAVDKIKNDSNNATPPAPKKADVGPQRSAIDMGRTFSLSVTSVVTPGQLEIFSPSYENALYAAPEGYQFVGEIFRAMPFGGVEVSGPVTVSIEFGATQQVGNPVLDIEGLRLVRLVDGMVQFLEDYEIDATYFVITGTYTPGSLGSGLNQWGEFAIVQVPAPGGVMCAAILAAAAVLRRRPLEDGRGL